MTLKLDKFQKLEALPVSTAVLDAAGRIVAVNEAWRSFGKGNGLCLKDFGVGASYFSYCLPAEREAGGLAAQLKDLLEGRSEMVTMVYPCHSPTKQRWFFLIGMPLAFQRPSGIAILHVELTSLLPLAGSHRGEASTAVLGAIERSATGSLVEQLRQMIADDGDAEGGVVDLRSKLSKRQLEVLRLLGEGKSNVEIANALFRSPHTIKLHVSAILKQLNLKSRTQAALVASKLWPPKGA